MSTVSFSCITSTSEPQIFSPSASIQSAQSHVGSLYFCKPQIRVDVYESHHVHIRANKATTVGLCGDLQPLLWQQDWYFFTGRPMMSNDIRTRNKLLQLRFFLQLTLSQHLVCCLGWILSSGVYEWTCVSEEDGMVARRISRQNFNIFKYETTGRLFYKTLGHFLVVFVATQADILISCGDIFPLSSWQHKFSTVFRWDIEMFRNKSEKLRSR